MIVFMRFERQELAGLSVASAIAEVRLCFSIVYLYWYLFPEMKWMINKFWELLLVLLMVVLLVGLF